MILADKQEHRTVWVFPCNVTIFSLTSDVDSETLDVAPHTSKYAS